jgi:schlafen family protein
VAGCPRPLEFKRDLSSLEGVLRSLVAFANTAGGTVIVSVEDRTRHVRGVKDPLDLEERLAHVGARPSARSSPKIVCSTSPTASTVAGARSIASRARSRRLTLTLDISQWPRPRNWAMAGASNEYRAAWGGASLRRDDSIIGLDGRIAAVHLCFDKLL